MPSSQVLLVLGSGPGIGVTAAKLFASKGHFSTIALLARDHTRLQEEKAQVEQAATSAGRQVAVTTYATDLTDFDALKKTLGAVEKLGTVGCVFFNAARIQPSEILKTSLEEIDEDFKVCDAGPERTRVGLDGRANAFLQTTNLALYITAQWAIPLLQASGVPSPTFVVTNSLLPEHPLPFLFSLSAVKASQQNMVHCLRAAFGMEVHIGLVKVGGQVSPGDEKFNPPRIAEEVVGFYEQDKPRWGGDVIMQ